MNTYVLLIVAGITLWARPWAASPDTVPVKATDAFYQGINNSPDSLAFHDMFTLADAERITGEPMHFAGDSTRYEGGVLSYRSSYRANSSKAGQDRPNAVYFTLHQFDLQAAARERFAATRSSNEALGLEPRVDLGDEAYFHTDSENFYFMMVRKGSRVFNLKVNKISEETSLEAFNGLAGKIADRI